MKKLIEKYRSNAAKPCPRYSPFLPSIPILVEPSDLPTYDSVAAILEGRKDLLAESVIVADATLATIGAISFPVERGQYFNELLYDSIGWTSGGCIGISRGLQSVDASRKKQSFLSGMEDL